MFRQDEFEVLVGLIYTHPAGWHPRLHVRIVTLDARPVRARHEPRSARHPKNDATTCGKPARNSHSTQDGRNNEERA